MKKIYPKQMHHRHPCKSSDRKLKRQLALTEKIKIPALTEPRQEIQMTFSGKLHNKHVTGEPYSPDEVDRYSKLPVVWICKSTKAKEVNNFFRKLHQPLRCPWKKSPIWEVRSYLKDTKHSVKVETTKWNIAHRHYIPVRGGKCNTNNKKSYYRNSRGQGRYNRK